MNMMKYPFRLLLLCSSICSMGLAFGQSPKQPLEQWTQYRHTWTEFPQPTLRDNQVAVVFYRLSDVSGQAINVYVNGHYQASLLPQSFTVQAVCSHKSFLSLSFNHNDHFDQRQNGSHHTLPAKQTVYFKAIPTESGDLQWQNIPAEIAQSELNQNNIRAVGQTLSRVPQLQQTCNAPIVLQTASISAETLFGFNQFAHENITIEGISKLAEFVDSVRQIDPQRIDKIVVSGHADPDGRTEYNTELSLKRAQTVQAALQKEGLNLTVEAEGMGAQELRVANCAAEYPKSPQQRKQCNAPNRRVDMTVLGKKL